jgi:hypothetical protein
MANGAAAGAAGPAAVDPQIAIDAAAAAAAANAPAAVAVAAANAPAAVAANAAIVPVVVVPLRTWDTLIAEAKIEPHTIAQQLIQENHAVPWEEAMVPFTRFLAITNDVNYQPDAGQWLYGDDITKNYYLTVIDNKWEVISGYRRCTLLQANGYRLAGLRGDSLLRLAGLRGDSLLIRGTVMPPNLFILAGARNLQSSLFTQVEAKAFTTPILSTPLRQIRP